jgi:hypothetical protein
MSDLVLAMSDTQRGYLAVGSLLVVILVASLIIMVNKRRREEEELGHREIREAGPSRRGDQPGGVRPEGAAGDERRS